MAPINNLTYLLTLTDVPCMPIDIYELNEMELGSAVDEA